MKINTAFAVIAALAGGSVALADSVDLKFLSTGQGRNVKFDLDGERHNVFAGQLKHDYSNGTGRAAGLSGTLITYCTDLLEETSKKANRFDLVDTADAPSPAMGQARADALSEIYVFAGGAQNAAGADRDFAAAFQLAVWEIVFDYDDSAGRSSLDIESGMFEAYRTNGSSLTSGVQAHLETLFDAIGTIGLGAEQAGLYALVNDGTQDQLIEMAVVPLPGAAAMGLAGLAGLAGVRRRR
jgi:MYXO-CTERM domain-containing protein